MMWGTKLVHVGCFRTSKRSFPMEHDVKILNSLIATTIDSIDGYNAAADSADNTDFRKIFRDRANERGRVVSKLQDQVRSLGGDPEDDGTAIAGAHRFFMNVRDTLTGTDDEAVVAEVERGEDVIKAKFETAMNDNDLLPASRNLVKECYTSVKEGHDQMRDLKHGLAGVNAL
jgi:uncharacterized protein (TIGR02284 family)